MSGTKEFVVHFWRTLDDDKPYDSVVVSATENLDESHIADVANRMVAERGDHSMSYEEKQ